MFSIPVRRLSEVIGKFERDDVGEDLFLCMLKTLYQLFVRFSTGLRLFRVDVGSPEPSQHDDR